MMQRLHDLNAYKSNPLMTLEADRSHTLKDLLLSKTAIGSHVERDQVQKAYDELIDLNYPLINRILEVVAFNCFRDDLFIYCASPSEFESIKSRSQLGRDTQGFFNPQNGLIVVSTRLPLSQVLIHEFTHAVRHLIKMVKHPCMEEHKQFCKKQFLPFFEKSQKTARSMLDRRDRFYDTKAFFQIEFYNNFTAYEKSDIAEEYLPFFLQHFVRAACHEKQAVIIKYLVQFLSLQENEITPFYNMQLLTMMYSALPSETIDNFVKADFRIALEKFVALIIDPFFYSNKIKNELKDSEIYSASSAEPLRINNYVSFNK